MKKIVLFVMLMMSVASVSAQWSVSPEVGLAAVRRAGSHSNKEWMAKPKLGVGIEYQFRQTPFSLKSGLYYTQRGDESEMMKMGLDKTLEFYSFKIKRNMLQIPLLATISFKLADDVRLKVGFGPYIGASLSDATQTGGGHIYLNSNQGYGYGYGHGYGYGYGDSNKGYNDMRAFDWGLSAAIGLEVKQWVINAGYEMSMGKEFDYDDSDIKYNTLSLSVGYKFKLGK